MAVGVMAIPGGGKIPAARFTASTRNEDMRNTARPRESGDPEQGAGFL